MIEVRNRRLIVPVGERCIGTPADNNVETRVFAVPRMDSYGDISDLAFFIDVTLPNNDEHTAVLEKVWAQDDKTILLTWNISREEVAQEGTIFVQIRGEDETDGKVRWASIREPLYVERALNPTDLSEDKTILWQLAARVANAELRMEQKIAEVDALLAGLTPVWETAQELLTDNEQTAALVDEYKTLESRLEVAENKIQIVDSTDEVTEEGVIYLVKAGS